MHLSSQQVHEVGKFNTVSSAARELKHRTVYRKRSFARSYTKGLQFPETQTNILNTGQLGSLKTPYTSYHSDTDIYPKSTQLTGSLYRSQLLLIWWQLTNK